MITLVKSGNTFIANGFLPKHTQVRIARPIIASSGKLKLIEVKALGRQCFVPLNRIGVKRFLHSLSLFRKTNDTFIDSLNAEIQAFNRLGIYPKLYLNEISPSNLIFSRCTVGRINKKKSDTCKYFIEGFPGEGVATFPTMYHIRIIDGAEKITTKKTQIAKLLLAYLKYFLDPNGSLGTNVAYVLPNGFNYGNLLYGDDYSTSGLGSANNADVVFYDAPAIDLHENSIILKPSAPSTTNNITFIARNATQPVATNFCILANMKMGANMGSFFAGTKIKDIELKFTFSKYADDTPNVVRKGQHLPPPPPIPAGA